MGKAILLALLFAVIGLVGFALVAPLVFTGNPQKLGEKAFPIIVVVFGVAGFWFGWHRRTKR